MDPRGEATLFMPVIIMVIFAIMSMFVIIVNFVIRIIIALRELHSYTL